MNTKVPKEIRVRGLDAAAVQKINQLAEQKNISRNAYLKNYLETLSVLGTLKENENKYISLVEKLSDVIENNSRELSQLRLDVDELIDKYDLSKQGK